MDPFIGGTAINAGASIVQNMLNYGAVKRNNEFQRDMWRENNEYNTPANQMKRFRDAGLNPHLIYGQGNSGNSSSAPSSQATQFDLTAVGNAVSTYLDLKKKDRDIENAGKQGIVLDNQAIEASQRNQVENYRQTGVWEGPAGTIRQKLTDLELSQKEKENQFIDLKMSETGAKIKNILSNTENTDQKTKISKLMEFIPVAQRERYEKYDILPDDTGEVQALKLIAKDVFGMQWEEFRSGFLDIVKKAIGI